LDRKALGQEYLTNLPEERVAKYRLMAAKAREQAHNSKTAEAIEIYMAVATAWETMAVELQHAQEAMERLAQGSRERPELQSSIRSPEIVRPKG
jgi:hypothetical protein